MPDQCNKQILNIIMIWYFRFTRLKRNHMTNHVCLLSHFHWLYTTVSFDLSAYLWGNLVKYISFVLCFCAVGQCGWAGSANPQRAGWTTAAGWENSESKTASPATVISGSCCKSRCLNTFRCLSKGRKMCDTLSLMCAWHNKTGSVGGVY